MATYNTNTYANAVPNYGSEQQWLATLTVNYIPANAPALNIVQVGTTVTFDKFSGGDVTSSVNKHRPGGMGPEITYISLPTFSDITVSKVYETQNDHNVISDLHQLVGRAMVTLTLTPLDEEGNTYTGSNTNVIQPRTYWGRLTGVKDGGTDSTSNAPRMYEVDIAVESISN